MSVPLFNNTFDVTFENMPAMGFCSVDGIEAVFEINTPVIPGEKETSSRRREQPVVLVLRRGLTGQSMLWDWYAAERDGHESMRNGRIALLNAEGEVILQILLKNAHPSRWRLSPLNALNPDVLFEEIELTVETIQIA